MSIPQLEIVGENVKFSAGIKVEGLKIFMKYTLPIRRQCMIFLVRWSVGHGSIEIYI